MRLKHGRSSQKTILCLTISTLNIQATGFSVLVSRPRSLDSSTRPLDKTPGRANHRPELRLAKEARQSCVEKIVGPFDVGEFASTKCWGTRPLLVRSAFNVSRLTGDESQDAFWPSWDDLIDISLDEDAESRFIQHVPNELESYTLELGPFSETELNEFSTLENNEKNTVKSTLVINDVDRFFPPLSAWMDQEFSFLPRWRRDDGQVSLAHKGGGIGPHVDNYDVFLIQTSGKRFWEIGLHTITVEKERSSLVQGIDVRIINDWEDLKNTQGAVCQLELFAGDLLYLPPRHAHCGTATTDDCMTLSVGCRAPSASDLVSCIAQHISYSSIGCAVERYEDSDILESPFLGDKTDNLPDPFTASGEITTDAKRKMKALVSNAVEEILADDVLFDKLVGALVTETKRQRDNYPMPLLQPDGTPLDAEWNESLGVWGDPSNTVQSVLNGSGALYRAEGVSFGFSVVPEGHLVKHRLFADGELFEMAAKRKDDVICNFLSSICSQRSLTRESLQLLDENEKLDQYQDLVQILEDLVARGLIYGSDD